MILILFIQSYVYFWARGDHAFSFYFQEKTRNSETTTRRPEYNAASLRIPTSFYLDYFGAQI